MPSRFLTKRVVLAIHRDQIQTFGGTLRIGDEGALDSALEQPQATFGGELLHPTLLDQAAAYLFHLAQNHPFVDGNKRVAFAAADVFLRLNSLQLSLSDQRAFRLVMDTASGKLSKEAIVEILGENTQPV